MPPIDRSSFSRRLGRLDGAAFERFVADLWAARGWRTSVEDGRVIAERAAPGGGRRSLVVAPADPGAIDDSTAAVVVRSRSSARIRRSADEAGATVIGPDELHRHLLYAVPRDVADELCREYLGRPLTTEGRPLGGGLRSRLRSPSREVLVLALVVAVLTAGIAGASLAAGGPGPLWAAAPPVGSPTSVPPPTDGGAQATPVGSGIACAESSTAVFEQQLPALAGHRAGEDGHRGVWRRATREFGWFSTSYVAFNRTMHERPFVHFLHHANASYQYLDGGDTSAQYRLVVTGTNGHRYGYVVTVEPEERASGAWCWRPTDLAYQPSLAAGSTESLTPTRSPNGTPSGESRTAVP